MEKKEAMKILKDFHDKSALFSVRTALDTVFPELKESEGERIRKEIYQFVYEQRPEANWLAWLEKQGQDKIEHPQNHQDINHPNGCIVLEDFNGGEGFYKLHLDYLNKEQVKEVEALVSKWNLTDEDIKNCIGLCLTDVDEQRFRDFNTNLRDCLDWLKKQGGKESDIRYKYLDELLAADDIYQMSMNEAMTNEARTKAVSALSKMCISELLGLEKQGDQKPMDEAEPKFHIGDEIRIFMKGTVNEESLTITKIDEKGYWSEDLFICNFNDADRLKLVEQKPTDKVEPKFHEGDWVVSKFDRKARRISEVHYDEYHNYYVVKGNEYNIEDYDRLHHLWSINDARNGDILACNGSIFIFKEEYMAGKPTAYCGLVDGVFYVGNGGCWTNEKCYPATKEQRNLLFQKIKDDGYEWDAEKKELEEIAVPIFNIGDTIIKKHNSDINKFGQFTITDITGGKYWYNDRIICDISEQNDWELVEQKSSWSEEKPQLKEGKFYECIKSYHYLGCGQYWFDKGKVYFCEKDGYLRSDPNNNICVYDWQSYFRPYPEKPTWSEEDCIIISSIKYLLHELNNYNFDNWLDSLKQRMQ